MSEIIKNIEPEKTPKIMFVDDEKMIRQLVEKFLIRTGLEVVMVEDGMKAWDIFNEHNDFDLVVTDQNMPSMTGTELAKKILSVDPDFPIILCTGYSETTSEEDASELGIAKYINKPIVISELLENIDKIIKERV